MHWQNYTNYWSMPFGGLIIPAFFILIPLLVVWSVAWKGIALWKSARSGHKWWFIALLFINTAGILEILYIYKFGEKTEETSESPK